MSVTGSATEQWDERGHAYAEDGTLTGTRVWSVRLDLNAPTPTEMNTLDALALALVPVNRYDPYPGYAACLLRSFSIKNDGGSTLWKVTANYTTKHDGSAAAAERDGTDGFKESSTNSNSPSFGDASKPADTRPYTIKTTTRNKSKPLEKDAISGARLLNAAGDPFDPSPETEETALGYQITWFVSPSNLRWASPVTTPPFARPDYRDTINSAAFKIFGRTHPARTLRVANVTTSMQWDKLEVSGAQVLQLVYEISVELQHKIGGWKREVLNAGRREVPTFGAPPRWILDAAGQPVADPVPLHASGRRLNPGEPLNYVTAWEYPEVPLIGLFT